MRKKNTILFLLAVAAISVGSTISLKTKAAESGSPSSNVTAANELAVGDTFTVSNITYRVSSTTGALEVQAISAPMRLTTISIPGSVTYNDVSYAVTSIPDGAFYGNYKTTKIILSEGVKTVGKTAFQWCDAVTEIVLPSTLESFTTIGFLKLESITVASESPYFQVKDGVLFSKNGSKLWLYPSAKSGSSYTVPSGTTTIVTSAFYQNQYLQTITLSNSVTTIEDYAFDTLNSLTSITLGGSVSSVGKYNFRNCPKLKSIVLKNSGTIGAYSINNCPLLETITIDGKMSGYREYVFYNLPSLKKYDVKNSPYYSDKDGVLYNKGELLRYPSSKTNAQYIVPDGTTKIAGLAFNYMQHTKEIILSPGVYVELMAFHYPNKNASMTIYFRDRETVLLSKSSSGVFVGLNSGSMIYLPSDKAVASFQSYGSAVNPKSAVTVSKKSIPATALKLHESSVDIYEGKSLTLKGTLTPYYSTEDIQWSSSNTDVATVSADGIITAIKKGTCKITAITDSGVSESCKVTVLKEEVIESTDSKEPDKNSSNAASSSDNGDKNTSSNATETKKESEKSSSSKKDKETTKTDGLFNKITGLFGDKKTDEDSKADKNSEEPVEEEGVFDKFVNIFADKDDEAEGNKTVTKDSHRKEETNKSNKKGEQDEQGSKTGLVIATGVLVLLVGVALIIKIDYLKTKKRTRFSSKNGTGAGEDVLLKR